MSCCHLSSSTWRNSTTQGYCHPLVSSHLGPALILSQGFPFRTDLENTLGTAISAMGPRVFLTYLPLGLDQQPSATPMRLWLLPLLKTHIRNTELAFFGSYFLPLAKRLKERSLALAQAGKGIEVRHLG